MEKGGGDPQEVLHKLFGSISRARILRFLYAFPGQNFYQREIMYETGLSLRPVQRELNNLIKLGIIKKQVTRNRVYYGINLDSPFFNPLGAICRLVVDSSVISPILTSFLSQNRSDLNVLNGLSHLNA